MGIRIFLENLWKPKKNGSGFWMAENPSERGLELVELQ